ncbi:hypothetical protein KI387_015018 [Taxus chinensis]|uniref:RING-type E3 ubiquitin transferase n=1 Tax=Taxus chinensis TaxID=29808 RepID=A0AA38CML8_TAXCH|nr:hypothetical protein KI387_015018 [Taxus chinensis]
MREPMTLYTGVTYDRESIERRFEDGHLSCPSTLQALDSLELVPNHTLKRLIQAWCSSNSRSFDAKLHAAQLLHGLLTADQNFKAIFRLDEEAFHNLHLLLRDGCTLATKTAMEILTIISPVRRNRVRAVVARVGVTLIDILPEAERNMAEKYISLLESLCQSAEGRASVCGHPMGILVLVQKTNRVGHRGHH